MPPKRRSPTRITPTLYDVLDTITLTKEERLECLRIFQKEAALLKGTSCARLFTIDQVIYDMKREKLFDPDFDYKNYNRNICA